MRASLRPLLLIAALLGCPAVQAQVYTCVGEDGTRIYSSSKCGPDAKVVPGVGTRKRSGAAKSTSTPKAVQKPRDEAELDQLIKRCDTGDMKACSEWTLGGGPSLLREKERKSELECEAGSLAACEERYCRDGIDKDCRARVLRTARLAGETWYLREESYRPQEGFRRYDIRCLPQGERTVRDISVSCATQAGPDRCSLSAPQRSEEGSPAPARSGATFDRLSSAAAKYCSD